MKEKYENKVVFKTCSLIVLYLNIKHILQQRDNG